MLNELRLLTSTRFDSRNILSVILAGDNRLPLKLRREELLPLGSRVRTRLVLEHACSDELRACVVHLLTSAGNASLMTSQLVQTLCDHALGNYRVLVTMANQLLQAAVQRELDVLDEKLYLETFAPPTAPASPQRLRRAAGRRR